MARQRIEDGGGERARRNREAANNTFQSEYNANGNGPTAAQMNDVFEQKSQKEQNLGQLQKNLTYTGKYKNAKAGLANSAGQSFLDYRAGIETDREILADLEEKLLLNPSESLRRQRDALQESIQRQESTLPFYEKAYRDLVKSYGTLSNQEVQDSIALSREEDAWKGDHQLYAMMVNSYRGDDMDELTEGALGTVTKHNEIFYSYMGNYLNEELEKAEKELAGLSPYEVGIPRETLQHKIAELNTTLFLLDGEKYRNQKKKEALSDPDFQKYVEIGKEKEKNRYDSALLAAVAGGQYTPELFQPFEDMKETNLIDQKMYYYFIGRDNDPEASKYKKSLQRQINQEVAEKSLAKTREEAEKNPLGYGVVSAIPNILAVYMTAEDMLTEKIDPDKKGLLADPNTPGQRKLREIQTARQSVLDSIENKGLQKGLEYVYTGSDMAPAIALDWAGAPGLGTVYRGILRGTRGYADKTAQGATIEDALWWAKANAASAMFLGNSSRGAGNGVNGGFPQQPGIVSQQGASLDLANPSLPGVDSGSPFSTISNVLGEQGAFQYLLGKNGYSLNNILAKPSAQQAYTLLRASGLEQSRAQQLLESNGYSAKNLAEPPASTLPPLPAEELRKLLNEPGLDVESTKRLMEREGYTTEPPNLLEGADPLQREEAINGSSVFDLLGNKLNPNLHYQMDVLSGDETSLVLEEGWGHRKGKGGDYGVAWSSIDKADYEACFSQLTDNEKVSQVISTRAKWLLNTYDGRKMETLYAIDLNDGTEIGNIAGVEGAAGVERSKKFETKLDAAEKVGAQILMIHNHPKGLPPSITDINALLRSERTAGITVGHDGSVYYYTRPEKVIPKNDFDVAIRKYKRYTEKTAQEKALDELAERYHFTWKKLR